MDNSLLPVLNCNPTQPRTRRKLNRVLQGYILQDILALSVSFFCAWILAMAVNLGYMGRSVSTLGDSHRLFSFVLISTGCLLWFQYTGHYRVRMNTWFELKSITSTLAAALLADGFFQFATKTDFSRLWLMSGWLFAAVTIVLMRRTYRAVLRRKGLWAVPTLLIGGGVTADDTKAVIDTESALGYDIVAHVKNLPLAFLKAGRSWEQLCEMHDAEYVIIALDGSEMEAAEQPLAQLMREPVPFSISPARRHYPVLDMTPQYFFNSDIKLLSHSSGLEQPLLRVIKRSFDILASGVALVLLSPLFLIIGLLQKRDGGTVFFGHQRVGKDGKPFYCLKFRSMIHNSQEVLLRYLATNPEAQKEWEETQKLRDDPRVTRFGQFLRRSSLDELPQLWNVLKGEMSLVGPRPIVDGEIEKYDSDIAHYYRVCPGITGLWQVSGRNDVTYEQRVQMDSWYVRNWSLWHDIAILCKTFPALMNRSGAY